jgi:hypothetical protein
MPSTAQSSTESAYRHSPRLRARLTKGPLVRHFEIDPVPKAHAWQCWVERDGPPCLSIYFTLADALEARAAYAEEIDACLRDGWELLAEQPS